MKKREMAPDIKGKYYSFEYIKSNFKEIPITENMFLYEEDRYDGILDGMLIYSSKQYWFSYIVDEMIVDQDNEKSNNRIYLIFESSEKFNKICNKIHDLFEIFVGMSSILSEGEKITSKRVLQIEKNNLPRDRYKFFNNGLIRQLSEDIDNEIPDFEITGWFSEDAAYADRII